MYKRWKVLIGHLLCQNVEKFINTSHHNFKLFFKIENLLNKIIGQGNKNKRWRPRKQLKVAEITKSTFDWLETLNLKRFCCIHLYTILLIHWQSYKYKVSNSGFVAKDFSFFAPLLFMVTCGQDATYLDWRNEIVWGHFIPV